MYHEFLPDDARVALDDGTGVEVMVRPESFAQFDLRISTDLERLETEWARFTVKRKVSISRRASWQRQSRERPLCRSVWVARPESAKGVAGDVWGGLRTPFRRTTMEAGFRSVFALLEVRPMQRRHLSFLPFSELWLPRAVQGPPRRARTPSPTPRSAGPDFAIQGEYQGETADGKKVAAQVIALGDGKFKLVGYPGGLPGDGWDPDAKTHSAEGQVENGVLKVTKDNRTATIADGKLTLTHDGQAQLRAEESRAKEPDARRQAAGRRGRAVRRQERRRVARRQDASRTACSVAGADSKRKFGDCTMHIEFRTPFQPKDRGQGRGNSGVYLQEPLRDAGARHVRPEGREQRVRRLLLDPQAGRQHVLPAAVVADLRHRVHGGASTRTARKRRTPA